MKLGQTLHGHLVYLLEHSARWEDESLTMILVDPAPHVFFLELSCDCDSITAILSERDKEPAVRSQRPVQPVLRHGWKRQRREPLSSPRFSLPAPDCSPLDVLWRTPLTEVAVHVGSVSPSTRQPVNPVTLLQPGISGRSGSTTRSVPWK